MRRHLATSSEPSRGIVDPAAAHGAFSVVRLPPAPELADVVERHWVVRWDLPSGLEHTQTVVPHPNANVVAEPDGFAAHGIPRGLFHRTLVGRGAVVGTKLRPGGLRLLTSAPDAVDPGRVLPADHLLGGEAPRGGQQAVAAALADDAETAVAILTPLLRTAVDRRRTPRAMRALDQAGRAVSAVVDGRLGPDAGVADLAELVGLSTRALQRLFAHWVGISPAWVLRRHRVHLAAELLAADASRDLATLAVAVGYYDQAHLGGDFARVLGVTPAAYARRCALSREALRQRA